MAVSALVRRCRSAAPSAAFIATALAAIVLAAQAQLVCGHEMVVPMPSMEMAGMHGMEMPAHQSTGSAIALCPIVLLLGIAAAVLCANAFALLLFDKNRSTTGRLLARACTRLPLASTALAIVAAGSVAVGIMMAVDGHTPSGAAGWLCLLAIVASIAVAATVLVTAAGRCALALTRRIAVAVSLAIAVLRPAVPVPVYARSARHSRLTHRAPVLAARRGLRAPPSSVR